MGDYVLRVLNKDVGVRVLTCTTTELAREAASATRPTRLRRPRSLTA